MALALFSRFLRIGRMAFVSNRTRDCDLVGPVFPFAEVPVVIEPKALVEEILEDSVGPRLYQFFIHKDLRNWRVVNIEGLSRCPQQSCSSLDLSVGCLQWDGAGE